MFKPNLGCSINSFKTEIYEDKSYKIIPLFKEFEKTVKELKEYNFNSIEYCPMAGWNLEEEKIAFENVPKFLKILKENGIKVNSVHLPFALYFYDFSSLDEERRKFAVEHVKWAMDFFDSVKPNYFIVHYGVGAKKDENRQPMLEQLAKSMKELCDYCKATICIENMTGDGLLNQTSEALWLLERVPKLMMVIDINHPLIETPEDYILKIGSRVKAVHVSDRDEIKERHWLPGKGVLNWNKIIGALDKIGYKGEFTYEVGLSRGACSIKDIKENYEKLFEDYNNK